MMAVKPQGSRGGTVARRIPVEQDRVRRKSFWLRQIELDSGKLQTTRMRLGGMSGFQVPVEQDRNPQAWPCSAGGAEAWQRWAGPLARRLQSGRAGSPAVAPAGPLVGGAAGMRIGSADEGSLSKYAIPDTSSSLLPVP